METPRVLRDFDQATSVLRSEVVAMATKSRHNLERAMLAVTQRNVELANAVVVDDDEVDEHERRIDQIGMEILVRFRPVATDLRLVVSSMKVSMNLERISDHATNIAKRGRKLSRSPELPEVHLLEPVYTLADQLFRDSITAFNESNAVLGEGLKARDGALDRLHKEVTAKLAARLEETGGRGADYLHLIFIVRSLERVGDLATNIGEDAVFLQSARDVRHAEREKLG